MNKTILPLFALGAALSFLFGCDCACTEAACINIDQFPITVLTIDMKNKPIQKDDLEDISVIELDKQYAPLDTMENSFSPEIFEGTRLLLHLITDSSKIYLVKNNRLDQIDTISVDYEVVEEQRICNYCGKCPPEMYTAIKHRNQQTVYNKNTVLNDTLEYIIK